MFEGKRLFSYLRLIIIGLFVVLVAVQSGKSFVLDEIDFPTVSNTVSQSGVPMYYHGEQAPIHPGTYHPTLYINTLATFIRAFGFNETSVRFFGVICVLLSAYLLVKIYRMLAKKHDGIENLFLGLYLLSPYTIANATLPDIDPTILPVLLLLFIYVSLRYLLQKKEMGNRVIIILGLLFSVVLWSKLTTPLVIPPFLACLAYIMTKDVKKSLLFTVKVAALGAGVFVTTYLIYCLALNLSLTYTYTFLLASFTKGTSSDGPIIGIINNIGNIRYFVYWITLPLLTVLGVSIFGVLFDKTNDEKTRIKKLLIATALLITIFYIALISPFGGFFKYPFPVFGILLLSIAFYYDKYLRKTNLNVWYAGLAILIGYVMEKSIWEDSMFLSGKPFDFLWVILIIAIASYVLLTKYKDKQTAKVIFTLVVVFAIGFQLSISRVQATAPYPTKYLYGQMGLDETADYLRVKTKPDEVIWSMKDVGFYVHNKFYESYSTYFDKSLQQDTITMLKEGKVRYYVATTGIGQDNINYYTDVKKILDENATVDKRIGNFIIYKSKNAKD